MSHTPTLGQLLRRWLPHAPKKWTPALVTDVYRLVGEESCRKGVDFLLKTNYFHNVLWRFFDQDAMIDHIELVVVLCLYLLNLGHFSILESVLKDENFDVLVYRLLVATSELKEDTHLRFATLVLKFLTQLVAQRPKHPKILRLKTLVFGPYGLTHLEDFQTIIDANLLAGELRSVEETLESSDPADKAQLKLQVNWLYETLITSLKLDTSKSDVSGEFVRSLLFLIHTCINQEIISVKVLLEHVDVLTLFSMNADLEYLFKPTPDLASSLESHILLWDESTLIDATEAATKPALLSLFPCLSSSIPLTYTSLDDFTSKQSIDIAWQFKRLIYSHLVDVLNRLNITVDRKLQLTIKGRSKYFLKIDSISIEDDRLELILPYSENESISVDDFFVVLAFGNPNKFSSKEREKKYGLELARLAKPTSLTKKGPKIALGIERFEMSADDLDRFNYILKLPDTFISKVTKKCINSESYRTLQSDLQDILLLNPESKVTKSGLGLDHLELNLGKDADSFQPKRMKLDQKVGSTQNTLETATEDIDISTFEDDTVNVKLNPEQKEALLDALQNRITLIETPPHSGKKQFVNAMLSSLDRNFVNERTLVVFPNELQVAAFSLDGPLLDSTIKVLDLESSSDPMDEFYKLLENRLLSVSKLVEFLGLEEKFPELDSEAALCFYEAHVKPRWREYVKGVRDKTLKISDYPFDLVVSEKEVEVEAVALQFHKIVDNFEQIEQLSNAFNLSDSPEKVREYLTSFYFKNVIASQELLVDDKWHLLTNYYDSVILIGAESIGLTAALIPLINNPKLRRLALLGDSQGLSRLDSLFMRAKTYGFPTNHFKQSYIQGETHKLFQKCYPTVEVNSSLYTSPLFEHSSFHVSIKDKVKEKVNVNEGEFIVKLSSVVSTVIGDAKKVSIICMSPFQEALLKEIAQSELKQESPFISTSPDIASNDYILVSLHNYSSYSELIECAKHARKAVVFVGDSDQLTGAPSGDLRLKVDDKSKTFIIHKLDDFETYLHKVHRKKHKSR